MNSIAFIDTEVEPKSGKLLDIGSIKDNGDSFHKTSVAEFIRFLNGTQFICGHNILNHDIKYIGKALKKLYDFLALIDSVRIGKSREKNIAVAKIESMVQRMAADGGR